MWVAVSNSRLFSVVTVKIFFIDFMYSDIHTGLKGNKHISEIVINYINEKETTNSWR